MAVIEEAGHDKNLEVASTRKKVKVEPSNALGGKEGHHRKALPLPSLTESHPGTSAELSVKATKSDDAKVNKRQWDLWSVDNFVPPTNSIA